MQGRDGGGEMRTGESEGTFASAVQFGFERDATGYEERKAVYGGQTVVYYRFVADALGRSIRVVPDGCIDILFCCAETDPHALVYGSVLQGKEISEFRPNTEYFGVRLSCWLSAMLPGLPLKELIETRAPLGDAFASYGRVAYAIMERSGLRERIACFEALCMPLLVGERGSMPLVEYCLKEMHRTRGGVGIRELATYAGYSERYVRAKFEHALGMSPKLYGRIVRFQTALDDLLRGRLAPADIGAEQGYYDQAHFVKEFKSFSTLTPMRLLGRK